MQPVLDKTQIHLRCSEKPEPMHATPLVFRATKDSPGIPDSHSLRTFDFSMMKSGSLPRLTPGRFEISLPHAGAAAISAPMVPQRPNEIGKGVFCEAGISEFFQTAENESEVKFHPRARAVICQAVLRQLTNVVRGAAQESRRCRNYYARPIVEREYTSCPLISHHFITVELYYSNYVRRQSFQESDEYVPVFFTNRDQQYAQIFGPEMAYESTEQKEQHLKIWHTLKVRGNMFKAVAKEADSKNYLQEMDTIAARFKNQMSQKPEPSFNPKAAEIFGRKDVEDKRLGAREITVADIVTFIEGCGRGARRIVSDVILERYALESQA